MNWSDVAEKVGQAAPMLGGLLGGPAGAGVGRLIAGALGVEDDPAAVEAALRADSDAALKLRALENDMEKARMAADTERQLIINETMRIEAQQDHWFRSGWRPALGWMFTATLGALGFAMAWTVINDPTVVGDPEFSGMLVWLFVTMGAALGINVKKRSDDKAAERGEKAGGFMDMLRRR